MIHSMLDLVSSTESPMLPQIPCFLGTHVPMFLAFHRKDILRQVDLLRRAVEPVGASFGDSWKVSCLRVGRYGVC